MKMECDPRATGGFTALRESQRQSVSVLGQITSFDIHTRMRNSISTYNQNLERIGRNKSEIS